MHMLSLASVIVDLPFTPLTFGVKGVQSILIDNVVGNTVILKNKG